MIEFIIPVHPVTKKNNMQIIPFRTKTGKVRHIPIPSKQYKEFEHQCLPYFYRVKSEVGVIDYPVNMAVEFYVSKKLKYDLTNLLEAIDDTAVQSGFILDDNRDIIAAHDGSRVFYDKANPRIEIRLVEMKEYIQWNDTQSKQQKLGI